MKAVFLIFKKHPVAIIFYLVYTLLSGRVLQIHLQFHETLKHLKPGESGLAAGGEAVGWVDISFVMITGIFLLVLFANAIGRKTETKFYLWVSAIVIIQTIIIFNIG